MSSKALAFNDSVEDQPSTERKKVSNAVGPLKEMVSGLRRPTEDKIDENLGENAESLPGGEKGSSFANAGAEKLSFSADHVRKYDVKRIMAGVVIVVKNNPGLSLLATAVIGFFVGRAFTSNNQG